MESAIGLNFKRAQIVGGEKLLSLRGRFAVGPGSSLEPA